MKPVVGESERCTLKLVSSLELSRQYRFTLNELAEAVAVKEEGAMGAVSAKTGTTRTTEKNNKAQMPFEKTIRITPPKET